MVRKIELKEVKSDKEKLFLKRESQYSSYLKFVTTICNMYIQVCVILLNGDILTDKRSCRELSNVVISVGDTLADLSNSENLNLEFKSHVNDMLRKVVESILYRG